MPLFKRRRRLSVLGAVFASAVESVVPEAASAAVMPRRPGETKVVAFMGGDYGHNPISLEMHVRRLFASKKDWRVVFVRASRFFTPELISDADLLITSRHSRPDDIDWRGEGLVDSMDKGELFWNDENAAAIVDSVKNRGMGFLALHNTIACGHDGITGFLDIEPIPHNEVQPLWVRDLNGMHPVTRGIENFLIPLDEQFAVVIRSHSTTTLFETTAMHDKRRAVGGWCLERGAGRIVGMLPGHDKAAYRVPQYRELLWRAAHWAMKRDIPPFPG